MEKKTDKAKIEELEAQVKGLDKLVNHYANKAMQLENQLVLSSDSNQEAVPVEQIN